MARTGPRFGAHMSVAGGLENAFQAGIRAGCDCLQIFVKNQRQWSAKPLTKEQIQAYQAAAKNTGLTPVIAHASYLLNLASPDPNQRGRSEKALLDELERCETLGVSGLVFHPGSRMDGGEDQALCRVANSLNTILKKSAGYRARILIETTAGAGRTIGHRFEHLGRIMEQLDESDRVGICLDTCHLFAAGYDFRSPGGYREMIKKLDQEVGLSAVHCIHTNDSKGEAGSHLDRHEHIGKGKIGKSGFAHFVNDRRFDGVPMILETPKGKDGRGADFDKLNIKRLRGLIRK